LILEILNAIGKRKRRDSMAEKSEISLAIPPAPKTNVMQAKEAEEKFSNWYRRASDRFQELRKMGLTVTRSGSSVALTSNDIKVTMPADAMVDDIVFNSFKYGLGKKLYDAEVKKLRREAVWAAIADGLKAEAEATLETS
jgi:hypothetical protein